MRQFVLRLPTSGVVNKPVFSISIADVSFMFLILLFIPVVQAQKTFPLNYLNQKHPGKVAQIFAPGLLTTEALEHSAPAFSPDGKTVVWTIMKVPSYQTFSLERYHLPLQLKVHVHKQQQLKFLFGKS